MNNIVSDITERFSGMTPLEAVVEHVCTEYAREDVTFVIKDGKEVQGYIVWENKALYTLTWELPESKERLIKVLKEGWEDDGDDFCNKELPIVPDYMERDSADGKGRGALPVC